VEQAALIDWLDLVAQTTRSNYALALQVARMRGLVKGYGDTHERGQAKFQRLLGLLPRLRERGDAAAQLAGLIKAALADESGEAFELAVEKALNTTSPDLVAAPKASSAGVATRAAS